MITTKSQFYYGHTISNGANGSLGNFRIDFDEGSGPLVATLNPGDYTLTTFALEVKRAMDLVGTLTYTVSVNRNTRILTISATGTFDLLTSTGVSSGTAVWGLLGFTTTADKTGASSYVGELPSGSVYRPQAVLRDYIGKEDNLEKLDAVVNVSVSGVVQTVQFGNVSYFEFNIQPITNLKLNQCNAIDNNPNAVQQARDFFNYAITKAVMEFMPDRDSTNTFSTVILESTSASKQGTAFALETLAAQVYESGTMKLREIT
jgi:hypothetical protein